GADGGQGGGGGLPAGALGSRRRGDAGHRRQLERSRDAGGGRSRLRDGKRRPRAVRAGPARAPDQRRGRRGRRDRAPRPRPRLDGFSTQTPQGKRRGRRDRTRRSALSSTASGARSGTTMSSPTFGARSGA